MFHLNSSKSSARARTEPVCLPPSSHFPTSHTRPPSTLHSPRSSHLSLRTNRANMDEAKLNQQIHCWPVCDAGGKVMELPVYYNSSCSEHRMSAANFMEPDSTVMKSLHSEPEKQLVQHAGCCRRVVKWTPCVFQRQISLTSMENVTTVASLSMLVQEAVTWHHQLSFHRGRSGAPAAEGAQKRSFLRKKIVKEIPKVFGVF